jgi:hypothetical protein
MPTPSALAPELAPTAAPADDAEPTFALLADELTGAEAALVDASARWLRQTALRHGVEHAVEVRDHILNTYFDGDYAAFSDPSRGKPRSFTALCARGDLPYKHGTLYAWVRIGQQVDELPPGVGRELGPSHHRALLPLTDPAAKAALAQEAVEQELTVTELEARVRATKPPSRAGRPPLPVVVKRGLALGRAAAALEEVDVAAVEGLRPAQREALAAALGAAMARLQALQAALTAAAAAVAEGEG